MLYISHLNPAWHVPIIELSTTISLPTITSMTLGKNDTVPNFQNYQNWENVTWTRKVLTQKASLAYYPSLPFLSYSNTLISIIILYSLNSLLFKNLSFSLRLIYSSILSYPFCHQKVLISLLSFCFNILNNIQNALYHWL